VANCNKHIHTIVKIAIIVQGWLCLQIAQVAKEINVRKTILKITPYICKNYFPIKSV